MTFMQRDREGILRPVMRVSIDRKIYDTASEVSGLKIIGSLLESLAVRYINEKRRERGEDPFAVSREEGGN